jgi:hypothetical protein
MLSWLLHDTLQHTYCETKQNKHMTSSFYWTISEWQQKEHMEYCHWKTWKHVNVLHWSLNVHGTPCLGFRSLVISHFNTTVLNFHKLFQWIMGRPHGNESVSPTLLLLRTSLSAQSSPTPLLLRTSLSAQSSPTPLLLRTSLSAQSSPTLLLLRTSLSAQSSSVFH